MMKDRLVLLSVAGLTAVATAGWMRQPVAVAASDFLQPAALTTTATQTPVPVQTVAARNTRNNNRRMPAVYDDRGYRDYRYDRSRGVEQKRSTKESVAIIGGSAAAGAAIGGLAGGGKGAAIGAVTGGAAGAVYDRATHKKRESSDDYRYRQSGRYEDQRSTGERVAIIGGGAAAGAAIGGMAGGGKGAAIGAVGGGAAGYVYDRMTRNK